jgi:hypothetical protein
MDLVYSCELGWFVDLVPYVIDRMKDSEFASCIGVKRGDASPLHLSVDTDKFGSYLHAYNRQWLRQFMQLRGADCFENSAFTKMQEALNGLTITVSDNARTVSIAGGQRYDVGLRIDHSATYLSKMAVDAAVEFPIYAEGALQHRGNFVSFSSRESDERICIYADSTPQAEDANFKLSVYNVAYVGEREGVLLRIPLAELNPKVVRKDSVLAFDAMKREQVVDPLSLF